MSIQINISVKMKLSKYAVLLLSGDGFRAVDRALVMAFIHPMESWYIFKQLVCTQRVTFSIQVSSRIRLFLQSQRRESSLLGLHRDLP